MKLKDRRYDLTIHKIREWLLNSNAELGAAIFVNKIKEEITEFKDEEINGAIKHLMGKNFIDPYSKEDNFTLTTIKLTSKGLEEWIFPGNYNNQKKFSYHTRVKTKN
ncbi:MAG: hypothetical protein WC882_05370 [Candidatus Gracilibacteria bacterium]